MNAPLAIKTRIHTAQDPNTSLDPNKRNEVSLEVLVQNISTEGMLFDRVLLEPVLGLDAHPIGSNRTTTLMPMDTKQFLFVLSPSNAPVTSDEQTLPKSVFPPFHLGGTVLPLGRLDVIWFSGPYRDPGRLQTSTLNRRVPLTPVVPRPSLTPSRTVSAVPTSPASAIRRTDSSRLLPPPVPAKFEEAEPAEWELDLVAVEVQREAVEVEKEFIFKFRLGMRDSSVVVDDDEKTGSSIPPRPVMLGIQYLTSPPSRPVGGSLAPQTAFFPSTRSPPVMSPSNSRPFSPLVPSTPGAGPSSRPMTPVSTQLRQATSQSLTSPTTPLYMPSVPAPLPSMISPAFPPPPFLTRPPSHHAKQLPSRSLLTGEIAHLGVSLTLLKTAEFHMVTEDLGTTYADPTARRRRWEVASEFELRFIALQEGLADLGGLRVLIMDDDGSGGSIAREWESLGDVWVDG